MKKLLNDVKEEMKQLIDDELYEIDGHGNPCDHDCFNCLDLEVCHTIALQKFNHEYAEMLDYGGYDTEEEFWEQTYGI